MKPIMSIEWVFCATQTTAKFMTQSKRAVSMLSAHCNVRVKGLVSANQSTVLGYVSNIDSAVTFFTPNGMPLFL